MASVLLCYPGCIVVTALGSPGTMSGGTTVFV